MFYALHEKRNKGADVTSKVWVPAQKITSCPFCDITPTVEH